MADRAIAWQEKLSAADIVDVVDLVARSADQDGVAAVGGHGVEGLADSADYFQIRRDDGQLIGFGVVREGDPGEVVVDPDHRRQGFGRQLVQVALEYSAGVWAHGDLPGARNLAARLALTKTRELLQMSRTLTDWPSRTTGPVELPAGVRVRTFAPGQDEKAFLAVNRRAFSWHPEQGRLDLAGLRAEMAQEWFDPAGFFLAVEAQDQLLAFHWTKVHASRAIPGSASGADRVGEVYVLGVDPETSIRGLGTALTTVGLDHLASAGLGTVMLYVEGDNDAALRLYRRIGFATTGTDVVYSSPS